MRLLNIPKMYKKEWQAHVMENLMLILNLTSHVMILQKHLMKNSRMM